ncbi:MAG: hypothetical protein ACPGFA_05360 [Pikeienuella sp.]
MLGIRRLRKKLRSMIRKDIAREAQASMLTYTAARQSLDLYEMRLETIDTRLGKKIRELEARVDELEAALTLRAHEPALQRKVG